MEAIFVDGIHEYDYTYEDINDKIVHLLFRSNNECWSSDCRG